jgi:hypothetical protein
VSPPTKENNWNEKQNIIMKANHNAPSNVVWVVQMSYFHTYKWIPKMSKTLREPLGCALQFIKPNDPSTTTMNMQGGARQ